MFKTYYSLAKPGIIYGNALTASGGFFLASQGAINFGLFLAMLAGISLVVASGCVFNNYIDRRIDALMERTKNRALVREVISGRAAIAYGIFLGVLGVFILAWGTNFLATGLALVGFFFYVVMYSLWKRRSVYGTVIGSVSGAVPPVVGYCVFSNNFDAGAAILFMIVVLWQMPHFYAIALRRMKDYASASIPVLPLKKGAYVTKVTMLSYIAAFIVATLMLWVFGYAGYPYLWVMMVFGGAWLLLCVRGFSAPDDTQWARTMFTFSLVVIVSFCVMISL